MKNLAKDYKNLKLNMAFHSIKSDFKSEKAIKTLYDVISEFQYVYPIKIVFLMTEKNKDLLFEFAEYVEKNFKNITKLTIGLVRNEMDYYNDNYAGILSFDEYIERVQNFLNTYNGKLDVDIFAEGMLYTAGLPRSQKNQINRFKCVFVNNKYTSCLYDIGHDKKKDFNPDKPIAFCDCDICPKTKKDRCLTDKIKLERM